MLKWNTVRCLGRCECKWLGSPMDAWSVGELSFLQEPHSICESPMGRFPPTPTNPLTAHRSPYPLGRERQNPIDPPDL